MTESHHVWCTKALVYIPGRNKKYYSGLNFVFDFLHKQYNMCMQPTYMTCLPLPAAGNLLFPAISLDAVCASAATSPAS